MLVACFCGHTDLAVPDGPVLRCARCGRPAHPPEIVLPSLLQQEFWEILARLVPPSDGEPGPLR